MADGFATTADHAASGWPGSRIRPQAVKDLEALLALLFPDPPSPDCITVDDMLRRYRFNGLSALALQAIEQSQRIVRARGDYVQLGVCEFHIGLIYFTWGDPRAAANQFLLARQSWTLAGDHAAKCLGHFAQGLALAEALHYEPAMLQYGRAERLLSQPPRHGPAATRHGTLDDKMRPLLTAAQDALRVKLWPNDPAEPAPSASEAADSAGRGPSAQPQMRTDDARPLSVANISNLPLVPPAPRRRNCPVPGHTLDDDHYTWYAVADRRGGFLSAMVPGIWLLADNDVDDLALGRVLVIVGSRQAGLGSISLRPFDQAGVTLSLYLGLRVSGGGGASAGSPIALPQLYLNEKSPVSGSDVQVLAVVRGVWRLLDEPPAAVNTMLNT